MCVCVCVWNKHEISLKLKNIKKFSYVVEKSLVVAVAVVVVFIVVVKLNDGELRNK